MRVVVEPADIGQAFIQGRLAGVTERRMTKIVHVGQGLGQVLVQLQRSPQRAGNERDLHGVRQPRAVVVPHLAGKDLRLIAQPAKRFAMHDPIAVALERAAIRMQGLGIFSTATLLIAHGVGSQVGARAGVVGRSRHVDLAGSEVG